MAAAFEPVMPDGAQLLVEQAPSFGHYDLPIARFGEGRLPTMRLEGELGVRTWRIDGRQTALTEISMSLSEQLSAQGYTVALDCTTDECGGFDFRFDTLVLPPPDMFVDIEDFRFLSGRRYTPEGSKAVGIMISRTDQAAMVQIVQLTPGELGALALKDASEVASKPAVLEVGTNAQQSSDVAELGKTLSDRGHVILVGLTFQTGSSALSDKEFPVLTALADWLNADETRRVALVGHSDSAGGLEANTELSQRRSETVMDYLVTQLGVSPDQLEAQSIGYLAPIESNTTEAGRQANRRVEAVLLP